MKNTNIFNLAEDVDMGERDLQHGGERGQADRDELASVGAVVRVHQVDTSQADVTTTQVIDDLLE